MWYIIAIAVLGIGTIIGLISCKGTVGCNSANNNTENTPQKPMDSIIGTLTRKQIIERLEVLAKKPVPETLSQGAMCYKTAATPSRIEYVCPVCGEKTLYNDDTGFWLNREISECRSLATSIKGINLQLDESRYCKKCSPDTKEEPYLCIKTSFEGEDKAHEVCGICADDLQYIYNFLAGKATFSDDYDFETPLKDKMERIAYLLGIDYKK